MLLNQGKYTFEVARSTNASEVKKEIARLYKVKVADVNIVIVKGKTVRRGRQVGRTSDKKKAIVTLMPGETISGISEPAR